MNKPDREGNSGAGREILEALLAKCKSIENRIYKFIIDIEIAEKEYREKSEIADSLNWARELSNIAYTMVGNVDKLLEELIKKLEKA